MADFTPLAPAGFKTELETAFSGKVATTGDETVGGVKTFTSSPVVPAPTTDLQAATKKYVDDNAGDSFPLAIVKPGEYIGPQGTKTVQSGFAVNAMFSPLQVPQTTTFDRIAISCTVAPAEEATLSMAIYTCPVDGSAPQLILDAGTLAFDTTGLKEITINQTLEPGLYFAARTADQAFTSRATNNLNLWPTARFLPNLADNLTTVHGTAGTYTLPVEGWPASFTTTIIAFAAAGPYTALRVAP